MAGRASSSMMLLVPRVYAPQPAVAVRSVLPHNCWLSVAARVFPSRACAGISRSLSQGASSGSGTGHELGHAVLRSVPSSRASTRAPAVLLQHADAPETGARRLQKGQAGLEGTQQSRTAARHRAAQSAHSSSAAVRQGSGVPVSRCVAYCTAETYGE